MIKLETAAVIGVVEAAYSQADSDAEWKLGLAKSAFQLVQSADGFGSIQYRWERDSAGDLRIIEVVDVCHHGEHVIWGENARRVHLEMPPALAEQVIGRTCAMPASASIGPDVDHEVFRVAWKFPVMDALGIVASEPDGNGLALAIGARETLSFTARTRTMLDRVAFHLAAGFRLRLSASPSVDNAEAVLTPNGKILHAHEAAKDKRDSLDDGRRRRDEARKTKHDAEKALEIWKGLVAGRWSLVDYFDTDGKRFLLAMKNAPAVDRRADLTPRERRVCALVSMGHRDKEIAYMLGLTTASVSTSLRRARVKLKVKTRIDLAAVWRRAAPIS